MLCLEYRIAGSLQRLICLLLPRHNLRLASLPHVPEALGPVGHGPCQGANVDHCGMAMPLALISSFIFTGWVDRTSQDSGHFRSAASVIAEMSRSVVSLTAWSAMTPTSSESSSGGSLWSRQSINAVHAVPSPESHWIRMPALCIFTSGTSNVRVVCGRGRFVDSADTAIAHKTAAQAASNAIVFTRPCPWPIPVPLRLRGPPGWRTQVCGFRPGPQGFIHHSPRDTRIGEDVVAGSVSRIAVEAAGGNAYLRFPRPGCS